MSKMRFLKRRWQFLLLPFYLGERRPEKKKKQKRRFCQKCPETNRAFGRVGKWIVPIMYFRTISKHYWVRKVEKGISSTQTVVGDLSFFCCCQQAENTTKKWVSAGAGENITLLVEKGVFQRGL